MFLLRFFIYYYSSWKYIGRNNLQHFSLSGHYYIMMKKFSKNYYSNTKLVSKAGSIFASQRLRFGSPFSPHLADLEYILMIHTLIFHWLRLPVHVSNQKTFYTEHMLSTKCKQRWHRNALI